MPNPSVISTPLGNVRLSVSVGEAENTEGASFFSDAAPCVTFCLPNSGRVISWQHPDFDLELLVCRPLFAQPVEFPVTDCWGALWRVEAKKATGPFVFSCVWDAGHRWKNAGPNGGQFLYAWLWEDECIGVTMGTQDDELLARRVHENELPSQWGAYFRPRHLTLPINSSWQNDLANVDEIGKGISNPLPPLEAGQTFQIPFLVAWANNDESSALATSLAAEATPTQILAGGNCA